MIHSIHSAKNSPSKLSIEAPQIYESALWYTQYMITLTVIFIFYLLLNCLPRNLSICKNIFMSSKLTANFFAALLNYDHKSYNVSSCWTMFKKFKCAHSNRTELMLDGKGIFFKLAHLQCKNLQIELTKECKTKKTKNLTTMYDHVEWENSSPKQRKTW